MKRVSFLHIGKTGGSAFAHAMKQYARKTGVPIVKIHGHNMTFDKYIESGAKLDVVFFVRDPVTRYVSAFNSRLRQGRPLNYTKWSEGERRAFALFPTPDSLAVALSATDPLVRKDAEWAISSIMHTAWHLSFWLVSPEFLEQHRDRIFYIAFQESLNDDFEELKKRLDLPAGVVLPQDEVISHRTPDGHEKKLSATGEANIRQWYTDDYRILDWCRQFANR